MPDLRTLLAAALGIGLGLLLLARPEAVIRAHTAGRLPQDRGGEYGTDAQASGRTRQLVQLLGAASLLVGLYFGATVLA